MLARLCVKNVALISEADIEFEDGLNVLSGETGSGKSVILDSINFVLGSKADRSMIRYGENEAIVRAEFVVEKHSDPIRVLEEYDIESDGTIIITRRLSADGKGAIKINGNTVTAAMLKNVTQHLVDVHGQSEHFFLLSEYNQLKVIDDLCGDKAGSLKAELSTLITEKNSYKKQIAALGGDESERARKLDLLAFQVNEIENADIKAGEFEELKTRQNVLLNVEKIMSAINGARNILNDDGGCCEGIVSAERLINQISNIDESYEQIRSRLESVGAEISDISETLSDLADNLVFDSTEAERVDERLTLIKLLKKKYGADEEGILEFKDKARKEYEAISDSAAQIERLTAKIIECNEKIYALCIELTETRKQACAVFCKNVEEQLRDLNIPNAQFYVSFKAYDKSTANLQSIEGSDEVCFEFSANKGEPMKPLNKVISGGEMSRFMLAIKTQLKDLNGISTYIFDEIDTGISGYTAGTVAKKFLNISQNTQILAVSHLPQVCAASDAQYLIYKIEDDGKTVTKVKKLTSEQKIDEVIRLTGGSKDSEAARINANELIAKFRN